MHQVVFDNRSQRKRREEGQRADDDHRAHQQPHEQRAVRRETCRPLTGTFFFAARLPAAASSGIRNRNRPINCASPSVRSYQGVFTVIPANALPLLPVLLV